MMGCGAPVAMSRPGGTYEDRRAGYEGGKERVSVSGQRFIDVCRRKREKEGEGLRERKGLIDGEERGPCMLRITPFLSISKNMVM